MCLLHASALCMAVWPALYIVSVVVIMHLV